MELSMIGSIFSSLVMMSGVGFMGAIVFAAALLLGLYFLIKRKSKNIDKKEEMGEGEIKQEDIKILRKENILLNLKSVEKEEAIKMAGRLLIDGGYVEEGYIQAMLDREKIVSTYIGNGVAIPHGVGSFKDKIKKSGIIVLQFPEGVDFDKDKKAYLVIGIAGRGNDHLKLLSNIAASLEDREMVEKLINTKEVNIIYEAFVSN